MLAHVRIATSASHLPRHFETRLAAGDPKAVVGDLRGDVHRGKTADRGQLVAEVAVDCLEPLWKHYHRFSVIIEVHVAAVDIEQLARLDGGVIEVAILGIQWVVDHK